MKRFLVFCIATLGWFVAKPAEAKIILVPADSSNIQAGINGAVDGDTVLVARGHYYERINFVGKEILVGSNYVFDNDTVTVDSTIIDGEGLGAVVTFYCASLCSSRIEGFTITNGNASQGGGIRCMDCAAVIANNVIAGNHAGYGGGIHARDRFSPIILHNRISGNSAEVGGGIWCESDSRAVIRDNLITGNQAEWGGGIGSFNWTSHQIRGNTITDNWAWIVGGGIYLSVAHGFMDSNAITGNSAGYGGGIYCDGPHSLAVMSNSLVANNTACDGGGLLFENWASCSLSCNVIVSNSASRHGGGIFCGYGVCGYEEGGTINQNVVHANSAGSLGGGIYSSDSWVLISNNIISDSPDGEGLRCEDVAEHHPTVSHNSVWNNADGNFVNCPPGVGDMTWGTNVNGEPCDSFFNISCPPLFCFPDTGDYHLAENSCCLGAGEGGVDVGAFGVGCPAYVLGDVNRDGVIDIVDLVDLIGYLYRGAPAPNALPAGDTNYDGEVSLADIVCLLNYVLRGGNLPC